jgi:nitrite reductase (NADH) large subunit
MPLEPVPTSTAPRRHLVIVGAGPAAHRLAEAVASRDGDQRFRITLVGEEPYRPYDRVALSSLLSGTADLTLGDAALWAEVELLTGERVVDIDPASRRVRTDLGTTLAYDELVLATGSYPFVPPVPGKDAAGCFVYRTVDDVAALVAEVDRIRRAERTPRAVVIGGGLLGLEASGGLATMGAEVSVVDAAPWLMATQLDQGGGQALGRIIAAQGVSLSLGVMPEAVVVDGGVLTGVSLADGTLLPADLVVFAVGVRPRDELAAAAGIERGAFGGVHVDSACRSTAAHIWAIGEVAAVQGARCVGLVAPANAMAEVVADRLLGGHAEYPGADLATKLKLSGVDVASFGDAHARAEGCLEVVYADPARGLYQKLVLSDDGVTLLGGILVGDADAYSSLRPLLGRPLPAGAETFLSAGGGSGSQAGHDLPDDAVVCSCNNVSAAAVRSAIRGEGPAAAVGPCTDIASLKACSRAGTGCGSCAGLVRKILDTELTAAGLTVSKALCEHFDYSRAELFESVRITGLNTFTTIIQRFGTGRGCDICKPVVASILASQQQEYILDGGRGTLQDTNDRAMANMQKDGTYSVVPRIPGGEITPQGLITIGQVAADFGLYTKITGGQRIDLFGARLEQLPDIWKRLVDAGFESGQAYGKALRTVKSCVGSTWCRFGVQDSVGMAIELELRYRGLRSPHKLKFGVSGCARECAEARSKDVGVIATENGWNVYVGGNGGFTPRHAQLLVSDVDDAALISIIDRFLMYYIRTADRLQRTAPWIESLDGGLDHLRDVIIGDSLGITADLEAAMARQVANYQDEWAATLANPERLRRFRSFVNAPQTADPSVARVIERGQPRPATAAERAAGAVLLSGTSIPVRAGSR